jgi:cysteine desulfurase
MGRIYLDYNAGTRLDEKAEEAYLHALKLAWANPGSTHREGQAARSFLAEARGRIAKCFSVAPQQVVFYSGATEGLNSLIQGLRLSQGAHFITSSVEHAAVWECCNHLQKEGSVGTYLKVGPWGAPSPSDVESAINDSTQAICLMSVNNETGVITDIEKIAEIAAARRIPFIVDGVAELGKHHFSLNFSLKRGISAAVFSSYKIHGPCGVGFALLQTGFSCEPLLFGGGQEGGKRPGSENVAAIYACSIAVEEAIRDQEKTSFAMGQCRDLFEKKILNELSDVFINGEGPRVVNTSNLSFSGVSGEDLLIQLDLAGVAASHGAACSAGALEPSRVLLEMGYSQARAKSSVRFSFGKMTTTEETFQAAEHVIRIVRALRKF